MENGKLKVESKNYFSPIIEIFKLSKEDIIVTSPGTETPWYEESDGIWQLEITP